MPAGCHPTQHNPCILGGFSAPWPWRGAEWGPGAGWRRGGTSWLVLLGLRELGFALSSAPLCVGVPDWQSWGSIPPPKVTVPPSSQPLCVSPGSDFSPSRAESPSPAPPALPCPRCSAAVPGCAAALGLNQALPVPWEPALKKEGREKHTEILWKAWQGWPYFHAQDTGSSCLLWGVFPLWKAPCHPPQPWVTDPSPTFPPSFPV